MVHCTLHVIARGVVPCAHLQNHNMVLGNGANRPDRGQASGKRSRGDDKLQQAQRK